MVNVDSVNTSTAPQAGHLTLACLRATGIERLAGPDEFAVRRRSTTSTTTNLREVRSA